VVTRPALAALLRDTLEVGGENVEFADSADWYDSLSGALKRYRAFVQQKFEAGAPWVRIVGDPVWATGSEAEIAAWFRYESLINLFLGSSPTTIVCPYDTTSVSEEVITQARRTHPEIVLESISSESTGYQEPEHFLLDPL
jgi:hypothetical protein